MLQCTHKKGRAGRGLSHYKNTVDNRLCLLNLV